MQSQKSTNETIYHLGKNGVYPPSSSALKDELICNDLDAMEITTGHSDSQYVSGPSTDKSKPLFHTYTKSGSASASLADAGSDPDSLAGPNSFSRKPARKPARTSVKHRAPIPPAPVPVLTIPAFTPSNSANYINLVDDIIRCPGCNILFDHLDDEICGVCVKENCNKQMSKVKRACKSIEKKKKNEIKARSRYDSIVNKHKDKMALLRKFG